MTAERLAHLLDPLLIPGASRRAEAVIRAALSDFLPAEYPALVNALEQANVNADTWRRRADLAEQRLEAIKRAMASE